MKKIILLMLFLMFVAQGLLQAQTADLPTGAGTSDDPYQIGTLNNLYWISQNDTTWDKYFEQTADIDAATTSTWDGGAGFLPIGNSTMAFTGSYDGQGGTVSVLTINRPTTSFVGLFGFVVGGEIKNIGVASASITGNYFVGGIAGYALAASSIEKCYASGTITGIDFMGGMIGFLDDGSSVDKSGSTVSVSGNRYVAGLVGRNLASITDCYAAGSVSGTTYTGGLAGDGTGTATNSFWDTQTSGQTTSTGGTGKTTSEMKDIATYTNTATAGLTTAWDFVGEQNDDNGILDWWNINTTYNSGYPVPSWDDFPIVPTGSGSETDPYLIATLNNLYWLTDNSGWYYIEQVADIPAYSTAYIRYGQGFKPISYGGNFGGHYNGNGHFIKGLTIVERSSGYFIGFISNLQNGGTISDLRILDADIRSNGLYTGVLTGRVGNLGSCMVTRCFVSGTIDITGDNRCCGMLVGTNQRTITECGASGTITKTGDGEQPSLGGLIGRFNLWVSPVEVSNCYSCVDIDGNGKARYIGGFCGFLYFTNDATTVLENCYSSGSVSGINPAYADNIGGFIGSNTLADVTFTACFWDTENSGTTDGIGDEDPDPAGVTGKTTAEMKTESTFTDAGWDFVGETTNGTDDYWDIDITQATNSGYPFLSWQNFPLVSTAPVTNIGTATAQCGGDVLNEGTSSVTAKGVVWDVSDDPTISSYLGITNDGSGSGSFTSNLTGLSASTLYYVRAYATNSEGTGYGSVIPLTTDMTPPGYALDFDGTDDYVSIPDESNFDFTNAMTVEAWIKVNSFNTDWEAIVSKGDNAWRLHRNSSTNFIAFSTNGLSNTDLAGTTDVNDGQWHHVAGVYNGSMKYLYVDGVLDVSIAATGSINNTSEQVYIAEINGNTDRDFNGLIDEVRIWDIDRSDSEISANMNTVLQGDETGLVAYYRFDQFTGSYLYDRTANNLHGILQNMDDSDWVESGWLNPTVITDEVTNIESSTAQCGGNVTNEGGSSVTAKGVVWDVNNDPTITTHIGITNDGSGSGSFTSNLTGLSEGTLYYVRAYATNSEGTGYGSAKTFTTDMTPPGNALDFDGTDDYVSIPDESYFDFTSAMTVEAWMKVDAFDTDWQAIVTKGDNAWRLHRHSATNHVSFGTTGLSNIDMEGTTDVNDGQWHHIAGVYDGSMKYLYVDGVLDVSIAATGDILNSSHQVNIAENSEATGRYFDGQMDEVRVWDIARSQTEISNNMNTGLVGNESGLVAYYRFDHVAGTVLADRTANELDGTLHNMDDSDWVPSTAPVPFYTVQNGNWETNGSWATGQNAPVQPWSRAKVKHNITLNSNMQLLELTIDTNAVMTISAGDTLTVGE